jgi:hypothetical protein
VSLAFYCVTGRDFFLGAVALVNSLRLVGHEEPIFVLDCGLEPAQRELLAREATLIRAPGEDPPSTLKLSAPVSHPAEVMALLDADLIVLRRLDELVGLAAEGRLVGFENESHRHFPEWAELSGGSLRHGPYLSSSALVVGGDVARELLPLAARELDALDRGATWLEEGSEDEPYFYADQDVLNALALGRLREEQVAALGPRLAPVPPFAGLRLRDPGRLSVTDRDGAEPFVLHHFFRKPWLVRMKSNVYSRLLTRLLLGDDVRLRLDPRLVPLRLRTGGLAALARLAVDLGVGVPRSIRRRVGGRPATIRAWPR